MEVIARIRNDFPTKFGLPRQSGLAPALRAKIVFEPAYRMPEALRGLDGFSHIWLIWGFSESEGWQPTVRPPRLGGNVRMGVFATRSPFRPNPIGLSVVRLERIEADGRNGQVLLVSGADLMDGTPIYDIKPYLPGVDAHPEATDGFTGSHARTLLAVSFAAELSERMAAAGLSERQVTALREVLAQDPRPAYHDDPTRVYGLSYAGLDIHFTVAGDCVKAF